ncbi:hypothetical protein F4805DRAFT_322847 [Annulohypoxylon moriforme]|nr:hypothetical protein F4805DRAFT_322847 [Annulohypoxylon moriforme]
MPSTPTPSLLLTKRLTAFLSSNLSPQIHTAALTTLSGKLLAHASPHPVGTLRTQCTVAASIWTLYSTGEQYTVIEALPPPQSGIDGTFTAPPTPTPNAVTIQLSGGVMVIRHLRCGLLFVCIGPLGEDGRPSTSTSQRPNPNISHTAHSNSNLNPNSAATFGPSLSPQTPTHSHTSPHSNPHTPQSQGRPMPSTPSASGHEAQHAQTPLGSPSEVASVASAGAATTASIATTASVAASAVVATRRQAEELARWLDDKLGSLGVLEEGLGVETR